MSLRFGKLSTGGSLLGAREPRYFFFIDQVLASYTVWVVVVDNGSADGSAAMVECEASNVWLLCNRVNNGFGPATNRGVQLFLQSLHAHEQNNSIIGAIHTNTPQPEYILLLNFDAFVEPDALAHMRERAPLDSTAGAIAPQLRNADHSLQPTGRPFPSLRTKLAELSGRSRQGVAL